MAVERTGRISATLRFFAQRPEVVKRSFPFSKGCGKSHRLSNIGLGSGGGFKWRIALNEVAEEGGGEGATGSVGGGSLYMRTTQNSFE